MTLLRTAGRNAGATTRAASGASRTLAAAILPLLMGSATADVLAQQGPVNVVTTLPVYADVVRHIGGEHVSVRSIAHPNEDAHFVRPKPSFALDLRRADMFVTTGLDLELWAPTLLDKAGNRDVAEGGRGYVTAYTGVALLDIPTGADRSSGDVHLYGNPHLHTDPLRVVQIARNIAVGLTRVAPDRREIWEDGLARFTDRIYRSLFGDELMALFGGETLDRLARSGNLFSFLDDNSHEGTPLRERLGGWLGQADAFRGRQLVCYHKNWAYFEDRFGVTCADYVEAKPGIPPTPRHVAELIDLMHQRDFGVVLAASYFDRGKVTTVAERGGAKSVIVPMYPVEGGEPGDYFALVDGWIEGLAAAYR